jgi:glyoxylase-like metal-dependent hydrolase (beta-lactamase superfamily II)
MNRRAFLRSLAITGLSTSRVGTAPSAPSSILEPWKPGTLDIHHLAYGRGNSTFVLCPDATTILIDAGTTEDSLDVSSPQRPNADIRPGEWIARYILRQMGAAGRRNLDYFLLTHLHPDHLGDLGPGNPRSPKGDYRLTGVMDVDARVPIGKLIDRGFPEYSYPAPQEAPFALNYLAYVKSRRQLGEACERIQVGRRDQIRLIHEPGRYPGFVVRNVAGNGEVWTGVNDGTRQYFPELQKLRKEDFPTENMCSIAIRVTYGKFDYFTGGDLTSDAEETDEPWRDIETPVARASGQVEVAVANHHAYFDAVGPNFVRSLQPRVFIIPAWYVAHPSIQPLHRMFSQELYKGDRDVYATSVMAANRVVNNQFMSKLKSLEGHVVVRVAPGGGEFRVIVCDNADDSDRVKAVSDPHRCS